MGAGTPIQRLWQRSRKKKSPRILVQNLPSCTLATIINLPFTTTSAADLSDTSETFNFRHVPPSQSVQRNVAVDGLKIT